MEVRNRVDFDKLKQHPMVVAKLEEQGLDVNQAVSIMATSDTSRFINVAFQFEDGNEAFVNNIPAYSIIIQELGYEEPFVFDDSNWKKQVERLFNWRAMVRIDFSELEPKEKG